MTMPSRFLSDFENKIGYVANKPCFDAHSLGTIAFVIDGITYELPSNHWNLRTVDKETN